MKQAIKFFAMLVLCAVVAMAIIYVATSDATTPGRDMIWCLVGTVSFILAAAVNPFRESESINK